MGVNNRHHFAHKCTERDIESAQQTALHMLSKEIIEEEQEILIQEFDITYLELFPQMPYYDRIPKEIHCAEVHILIIAIHFSVIPLCFRFWRL